MYTHTYITYTRIHIYTHAHIQHMMKSEPRTPTRCIPRCMLDAENDAVSGPVGAHPYEEYVRGKQHEYMIRRRRTITQQTHTIKLIHTKNMI